VRYEMMKCCLGGYAVCQQIGIRGDVVLNVEPGGWFASSVSASQRFFSAILQVVAFGCFYRIAGCQNVEVTRQVILGVEVRISHDNSRPFVAGYTHRWMLAVSRRMRRTSLET